MPLRWIDTFQEGAYDRDHDVAVACDEELYRDTGPGRDIPDEYSAG